MAPQNLTSALTLFIDTVTDAAQTLGKTAKTLDVNANGKSKDKPRRRKFPTSRKDLSFAEKQEIIDELLDEWSEEQLLYARACSCLRQARREGVEKFFKRVEGTVHILVEKTLWRLTRTDVTGNLAWGTSAGISYDDAIDQLSKLQGAYESGEDGRIKVAV